MGFDYQVALASSKLNPKSEYRLTQLAQGRWKCSIKFGKITVEMPERLKGKAKKMAQKELLPKIEEEYGFKFDLPDAKIKWAEKLKKLELELKKNPKGNSVKKSENKEAAPQGKLKPNTWTSI